MKRALVYLIVVLSILLLVLTACGPAATPTPIPPTPTATAVRPTPTATIALPTATPAPTPTKAPPTATSTPAPVYGGTLRATKQREFQSMDPIQSGDNLDLIASQTMIETLLWEDAKFTGVYPQLAESWTMQDEKTWILKLRKGIKFHDGTDFNAEAAKFNLDRVFDPNSPSFRRTEAPRFEGFEVVDEHTLKIKLKAPWSRLLSWLASNLGAMSSPTAIKKYDPKDIKLYGQKTPTGTGPFKFVEWVTGSHIKVVKNDAYWGKDASGNKLPYLDAIEYKPIPDPIARLAALRTGGVDLIKIEAYQVEDLQKEKKFVVMGTGLGVGDRLTLNITKDPFTKKAVRQAIAWSIDREAIIKQIYFGLGQPAYSDVLGPDEWAHDPTLHMYGYDIKKAKALLAEAGLPGGFSFKVNVDNDLEVRLGEVMQQQLAPAGIKIEPVLMSIADAVASKRSGEFQSEITAGAFMGDSGIWMNYYRTDGGSFTGYSNAEVDALLAKADQTYDRKEVIALYQKALRIVSEDSPIVYWVYTNLWYAASPKVKNYTQHMREYSTYVNWVWLEK